MSGYYDYVVHGSADNINEDKVLRSQNRLKSFKMWRSTSLINLVGNTNKNRNYVYESIPFSEGCSKYASAECLDTLSSYKSKKTNWGFNELEHFWETWSTIVTIVLVAAKGILPLPNDSSGHELYCKFRLGSETFKSKSVPHSRQLEWRERFKLRLFKDHLLRLSLWNKGRQKLFMGSCIIDLSRLEKERTHDIWQELDDGYGFIHLSVTMCVARCTPTTPENIKTDVQHKHSILDLKSDWRLVGCLHIKVIKARGLSGKPSAYCTLELDNERLQTHSARSSSEPTWNKSYVFNVYDVTSVLKLKVRGTSLPNALLNEFLGQVTIPLLKIINGESRWYALKSRSNRTIANGNYPRILLQMSITWNPIKATLRLFQPKEMKHIVKHPKRDVSRMYANLAITANHFNTALYVNEQFKYLFEWSNREMSAVALLAWLVFCYQLKPWMVPFILFMVFIFFRIYTWIQDDKYLNDTGGHGETEAVSNDNLKVFEVTDNKGITNKITDMQEVITTVSHVVELAVSVLDRLKNLFTFQVPFLSYVVMFLLGALSIILYIIPFNYVLMSFGIYKFMRKYLNPDRILNNDLVDFISRIPDDRELRDWKELNVPEPKNFIFGGGKIQRH